MAISNSKLLNTGVVTTAMLNTVANRTVNGMYAQPINYPNQIINKTEPNLANNYDPESCIYSILTQTLMNRCLHVITIIKTYKSDDRIINKTFNSRFK